MENPSPLNGPNHRKHWHVNGTKIALKKKWCADFVVLSIIWKWIMSTWWSVNKSKPTKQLFCRCVQYYCSHSLLLIHDVSSMSFFAHFLTIETHTKASITRANQKCRQRHTHTQTLTNKKRDWQKSNDNCFLFHLKIF